MRTRVRESEACDGREDCKEDRKPCELLSDRRLPAHACFYAAARAYPVIVGRLERLCPTQ